MAKEQQNNELNESLKLSENTLSGLSSAVLLLSQIKGLVYEIASNPIAAPLAIRPVEQQIVNFINHIRKLKEELKQVNKEASTFSVFMKDPRTWGAIGASSIALGLRIRSIKDEFEKLRLELYKIGGEKSGGAFGIGQENALGITKAQVEMQRKYGKEYADLYVQTVTTLQERLRREKINPEKQKELFEAITGLSQATGIDFSKAIVMLQDKLGAFKTSTPEIVTSLKLIEEAWLKNETAIGSLNENLEASEELISEFIRKGMRLPDATRAVLELQRAASTLSLSVGGMLNLFKDLDAIQEFGSSGIQTRLKIVAGLQTIPGGTPKEIIDILKKYKGLRTEEALFAMKYTEGGMKDYLTFMQQYFRAILPMKEGKVDRIKLSKNEEQLRKEFFIPANIESAIKLAEAEDVSKIKDTKDLENFKQKFEQISKNPIEALDESVQELLKRAGTWQDVLESLLSEIKLLVGSLDKLSNIIEIAAYVFGGYSLFKWSRGILKGKIPGGGVPETPPPLPGTGGGGRRIILPESSTSTTPVPTWSSEIPKTPTEPINWGETNKLKGTSTLARGASKAARYANKILGPLAIGLAGYSIAEDIKNKNYTEALWSGAELGASFIPFVGIPLSYGMYAYRTSPMISEEEIAAKRPYRINAPIPSPSTMLQDKSETTNLSPVMSHKIINVEAKVFIDSEQVASRIEQKINHSQSTTPSKP
jgi:hypothetical protein